MVLDQLLKSKPVTRKPHIFIYDPVHGERIKPSSVLKLEFLSKIPDDAKMTVKATVEGNSRKYPVAFGDTIKLPDEVGPGHCKLQITASHETTLWVSQVIALEVDPDATSLTKTGKRIYCAAPWVQMNVGKANASPCCNFARKFRNPYRDDAEDFDPWNSKTMQSVRSALVRGDTKYCHQACRALTHDTPEVGLSKFNSLASDHRDTSLAREAFLRGDTVLPTSPLRIKLTVNHFCNHACLFCARDIRSSWKANEAIFVILKQHFRGVTRIGMTGGEPLVFLDEMGGRLQELEDGLRGVTLEITTNASLIERSIDFLTAIDDLRLYVSLNAATRESYLAVHRKDHFDKVITGIRLLKERRAAKPLYIRLKMVIMRQNMDDVAAFAELGKSLGVDEVKFTPALLYEGADMTADDHLTAKSAEWKSVEMSMKRAARDLNRAGIMCRILAPGWKREDVDVLAFEDD